MTWRAVGRSRSKTSEAVAGYYKIKVSDMHSRSAHMDRSADHLEYNDSALAKGSADACHY